MADSTTHTRPQGEGGRGGRGRRGSRGAGGRGGGRGFTSRGGQENGTAAAMRKRGADEAMESDGAINGLASQAHARDGAGNNGGDARPVQRPREAVAPASSDQQSHLSDMRFDSLAGRIQPELLSSIPFSHMTTVQAATLEPVMSGIDVLAQAKTGTGKTIAFLLPTIQRLCSQTLSRASPCPISVLILSPTRELALQIEKEAKMLLRGVQGKIAVQHCIGGTNMSTEQRILRGERCDILVATPGRLLDHISNSGVQKQMSQVQALVLDEADRMLDMGFRNELMKIVDALPPREQFARQTLLFSATIPPGISQVAKLHPNHAVINTLLPHEENTHEHVKQTALVVPHDQMFALTAVWLLMQLHEDPNATKVIMFFPTARTTGLFAALLRALQSHVRELAALPVYEVHSRKSQSQRVKANGDFGKAQRGVLCSSDVTARGIDFPGVTHVFQVGLPASAEQYIHRLGRTARAGKSGGGTLILAPYEAFFLRKRDVASLPITQESSIPDLTAMQQHIVGALADVSEKEKCQAYQAAVGYYKAYLKDMHWSPAELVSTMNDWARTALRFQGGAPGLAPPLLAKTVGKMGLKGTPGLNVVRELPSWADDDAPSNGRAPPQSLHQRMGDGRAPRGGGGGRGGRRGGGRGGGGGGGAPRF